MTVNWEAGDMIVFESGEQLLVSVQRRVEALTPDQAAELGELFTAWALEAKAQQNDEGNVLS